MITAEGRRKRITEAIRAWRDKEESARETLPLHWRGGQSLFPVVELGLDTVLLNSKSHRLRAQLESHPDVEMVANSPWSAESQAVVEGLLRKAHRDFDRLKDSLSSEGQRQPGVVTREGVLLNANSRAVALRDLDDPNKRWIRVAVLPEDAEPQELAELELSLQMQEELKDEYSLTNELLFIEELSRQYKQSDANIASALRWRTRTGTADVAQRRRILDLIREMQQLTDPPIPLTFFDGKLEQLKALEVAYNRMTIEDPSKARHYRDSWLTTALAGQSAVHQLRRVDDDFIETYFLPSLAEQELLRDHADSLVRPGPSGDPPLPGLVELDPEGDAGGGLNLRPLMSLLVAQSLSVPLPDGVLVDRTSVQEAIARAAKDAINNARVDKGAENRLDAPVSHLREAATRIRKTIASLRELRGTQEFEQTRRGKFNYQVGQVRRLLRQLEDLDSGKEAAKGKR